MAILSNARELPAGRLLALDLGQARHGVAVSDVQGLLATPLMTLARYPTRAEDFDAIAALVRREQVVGVLVGFPSSYGDDLSAQARWVRRYAGRLAGALSVPVAFWDETLSTHDAGEHAAVVGGRIGVDAVAAALILQSFLDARRDDGARTPGSADATRVEAL